MFKLHLKYEGWILITVFFIFFVNLDVLYINIMETRNMLTAREMIDFNHWLLTTLDGLPRYEKPPLPTWITALFGGLFGFNSFVVMRLPAALMSLLTIWMVYQFSQLIKLSKLQAFIGALIMASTFYLIFSGRTNQWDIYTHAFMLVSIFYLWKFLKEDQKGLKNALLAALFFGFSFMSKGPIALYTLWLPFIISYGFTYKFQSLRKKIPAILSFFVIGFGIGLWWFIYVRMADPESFVAVMEQESSRWGNYNTRPFYYYWNFFIQTGVWTIPAFVSLLYPYLKHRVSDKKAYTFTLLWTLSSVVLLSLVPEKKPRYLLPALIPLAINTSFYIEYLFRKFSTFSKRESAVVYFNFGLIGLIGITFPIGAYFILDLQGKFWIWYILSSLSLFSTGCFLCYSLKHKDISKVFYLTIVLICCVMTFVFPLTDNFVHNPKENNISQLHKKAKEENFQVYEYGEFAPQVIWEYGEPIPQINPKDPIIPKADRFGIIVQKDGLQFVDQLKQDYHVITQERYDMNYVPDTKRGYKDWLVRYFFLLEKK